jgi:alpha-L-fucosidase
MGAAFEDFAGRPCPDWFAEPQLGVFIHWGIYAIPAWAPRGRSIAQLTAEEYDNSSILMPYAEWYRNAMAVPDSPTAIRHAKLYGDAPYENFRPAFDEASQAFDATAWADLFAQAGARYVVFVTKHHDGYCLWPTEVAHPTKPNWYSRRDFVGELAGAVRARGLRFGLYYSGGLDWTFRLDPAIRNLGDMFACVPTSDEYRAYAGAQVRELIDRYKPSVLWNDIAWPDKADVPQLFEDYYRAVPDGGVNDRWLGERVLFEALRDAATRTAFNDRIKAGMAAGAPAPPSAPPHCDFRTVEYGMGDVPAGKKWEACRGVGLAFGYNQDEIDSDYLDHAGFRSMLDDTKARGGNLLINIGPMADGSIPAIQRRALIGS